MKKSKAVFGLVTMQGKPIALLGAQVEVGSAAPDFKAVQLDFKPVSLANFKGRPCLISAVPSLDTQVCSLQTRRFNAEISTLPAAAAVISISMDLPFAQKRFCEEAKTDRIITLSDHVWREFGMKYGLLIDGMGILARAVFVIDAGGVIVYKQLVPELSDHPDYDAALKALRGAT